jgi:hypothetical protein
MSYAVCEVVNGTKRGIVNYRERVYETWKALQHVHTCLISFGMIDLQPYGYHDMSCELYGVLKDSTCNV